MTHTIFKWLTFVGIPLTAYLLWGGWDWSVGLVGAGTFLSLCMAAYTE